MNGRTAFLYLFLKPLDFLLERVYLCAKLQVLRLENFHLRFQRFKLLVEEEHLLLLLQRQRDPLSAKNVRNSTHSS